MSLIILITSCDSFLEEEPKSFLSPDFYFESEAQINAAVNGIYTFLDNRFEGVIGPGTQTYLFLEYLHGYAERPYSSSNIDLNQAINLNIQEENTYVEKIWETSYKAINNCNSVIENIAEVNSDIIDESNKNNLWGEVYFLRAFHYFDLVRLYGEVPLILASTKDANNNEIELSTIENIYLQIEKDLLAADSLMQNNTWSSIEGRVAKGAVKTLLAKVYLTMAGYPLQKSIEYYEKAYEQAQAVAYSGNFYLFNNYSDLRNPANDNSGEFIFMIQRDVQYGRSPVHFNLLPYPEPIQPISVAGSNGGALAPALPFYDSYIPGDKRTEEKGFFYTKHESLDDPNVIVDFERPFIYKHWDNNGAESGTSGSNYPLLTFADVLLTFAEAKIQMDGGTTTDMAAISAYFWVRSRANPGETKPNSLIIDDVLKERFWEMCYEGQTWYDMLRTKKALNVTTGNIVDLIGYNAPGHPEGFVFEENDLLFPYPLREKRLNPNLTRD